MLTWCLTIQMPPIFITTSSICLRRKMKQAVPCPGLAIVQGHPGCPLTSAWTSFPTPVGSPCLSQVTHSLGAIQGEGPQTWEQETCIWLLDGFLTRVWLWASH